MGYAHNRNYIYRNNNGGIYQDTDNRYKVDWFDSKYVPDVSISFYNYHTAYCYLCSIN